MILQCTWFRKSIFRKDKVSSAYTNFNTMSAFVLLFQKCFLSFQILFNEVETLKKHFTKMINKMF